MLALDGNVIDFLLT